MPRGSTDAPAFAPFHAVYAEKLAPMAFQSSSVRVFLSFPMTIDFSTLKSAAHAGLTGPSRSISAFPVMRAIGYDAISSVLPLRFSELMDSIRDVCILSAEVLSG